MIFDMDGTLVNSMIYWDEIAREYLESEGVAGDLTEVLECIRPKTLMEAAAYLIGYFGFDTTPEKVVARLNEIMAVHYEQHVEMKPGVKTYLEELRKKNTKMCVASATKEPLMRLCLERQGILEYFEFLISCEEVGAGKDRPTVYYAAAKKLGAFDVGDVAVFEDSFHSALTAHKAGFYVVGIYDVCGKTYWDNMKNLADECIIWEEQQ